MAKHRSKNKKKPHIEENLIRAEDLPFLAPPVPAEPEAPPIRRELLDTVTRVAVAVIAVAAVAGLFLAVQVSCQRISAPAPNTAGTGRYRPPPPPENLLLKDDLDEPAIVVCDFARHRNANDPRASVLLPPAPPIPEGPISEAEADEISKQLFIHSSYQIKEVWRVPRRDDQPPRFVLVTTGSLSGPILNVKGEKDSYPYQRVLFNADMIVELRDGKIHVQQIRNHREQP